MAQGPSLILGRIANAARGSRLVQGLLRWRLVVLVALTAGTRLSYGPGAAMDYSVFQPAGHALVTGNWHAVYANPVVQAGPFELLPFGVLGFLARIDRALPTEVMTWVGPFLVTLAVVYGVRVLRRARQLDPAPALELLAGALAALWGLSVGAGASAHIAELLIPGVWVASAVLVGRDRLFQAAVLIGLSAGFETWGILGLPVLALAPRLRQAVLPGLVAAGVAALCYLPFMLFEPFNMLHYRWYVSTFSVVHLVFPGLARFSWAARVAQAACTVGLGAVAAVLLRRCAGGVWLVPLVIVLVRLTADPIQFAYYWWEAQLLVLFGVGVVARVSVRSLLPLGVLAWIQFTGPLAWSASISLGWLRIACLGSSLALVALLIRRELKEYVREPAGGGCGREIAARPWSEPIYPFPFPG